MLRQADALAETLTAKSETLEGNAKRETQEIIVSYYLHKSAGCLNNGRFVEGKSALKAACRMLATWTANETILHAEAQLVTSQFQLLPTGLLDVGDLGDDTPHATVLLALATVKELARNSIMNGEG